MGRSAPGIRYMSRPLKQRVERGFYEVNQRRMTDFDLSVMRLPEAREYIDKAPEVPFEAVVEPVQTFDDITVRDVWPEVASATSSSDFQDTAAAIARPAVARSVKRVQTAKRAWFRRKVVMIPASSFALLAIGAVSVLGLTGDNSGAAAAKTDQPQTKPVAAIVEEPSTEQATANAQAQASAETAAANATTPAPTTSTSAVSRPVTTPKPKATPSPVAPTPSPAPAPVPAPAVAPTPVPSPPAVAPVPNPGESSPAEQSTKPSDTTAGLPESTDNSAPTEPTSQTPST